MGLKSGSRDAGLDDDGDENETSEASGGDDKCVESGATDSVPETESGEETATEETTSGEPATSRESGDEQPSRESAAAPGTGVDSTSSDTASAETTSVDVASGEDTGTDAPSGEDGRESEIGPTGDTESHPSVESLPYVLRRDRVNEGRDQVPFFLREEVVDGERALREQLETMLGEDVYKSDYREAAMVVAQERPELIAEVLRRWGYDLS